MKTPILDIFAENDLVKICAPMVRYSKLQFRTLVRNYDCDICYTPMIMADSFCKSGKARQNEFTTNIVDTPLVVQFGAKTVHDFVGAAYMVVPYSDGVEINCGCPQRWALSDGYGAALLSKPELISDLIKQCRGYVPNDYTISAKIRLQADYRKSIDLCKQLEKAGVSYITVHGRTPTQRNEPINLEAITEIKQSLKIPVVANGDIKSLTDAVNVQQLTNCDGVMVARGILTNPTLFSGTSQTTSDCIKKWLDICFNTVQESFESSINSFPENNKPENLTFQCFHHHLVFMLEKVLPKKERLVFNNLHSFKDVVEFLRNKFDFEPELFDQIQFERFQVCKDEVDVKRLDIYTTLLEKNVNKILI